MMLTKGQPSRIRTHMLTTLEAVAYLAGIALVVSFVVALLFFPFRVISRLNTIISLLQPKPTTTPAHVQVKCPACGKGFSLLQGSTGQAQCPYCQAVHQIEPV